MSHCTRCDYAIISGALMHHDDCPVTLKRKLRARDAEIQALKDKHEQSIVSLIVDLGLEQTRVMALQTSNEHLLGRIARLEREIGPWRMSGVNAQSIRDAAVAARQEPRK